MDRRNKFPSAAGGIHLWSGSAVNIRHIHDPGHSRTPWCNRRASYDVTPAPSYPGMSPINRWRKQTLTSQGSWDQHTEIKYRPYFSFNWYARSTKFKNLTQFLLMAMLTYYGHIKTKIKMIILAWLCPFRKHFIFIFVAIYDVYYNFPQLQVIN